MRALVLVLVILVAGVGTFRAVTTLADALSTRQPAVALDGWMRAAPGLARLADRPRSADARRIVFLGDSTAVLYPPGLTVPDRLQTALRRQSKHPAAIHVQTVGYGGMSAFDYYFLADAVQAAQPDQVVMSLNLRSLSPGWQSTMARPELASWIRPSRWPEAVSLPLHAQGVTFDGMLFGAAIVHLGGADAWWSAQRTFARAGQMYGELARRLQPAGNLPRVQARGGSWAPEATPATTRRERADQARAHFGAAVDGAQPDDPLVRMLAASVRDYVGAGIHTEVYVAPVNVEHFRRIGVWDTDGLARTLRTLCEAVEENGGHFVDLHDLLPDAAFRDDAGHFTVVAPWDGPARVAARLADPSLGARGRAGCGTGG